MRHYQIADVVVEQDGKYHLQLRNGSTQSGAMGQIGVFGGEIEAGETSQEAACRELFEETNVSAAPEQLEYIGEITFDSDKFNQTCTVHADIYLLRIGSDIKVEAREGELVTLSAAELGDNQKRLSAVARAFYEKISGKEN